ncbi:Glutathione S-transferase, omega [Caenispirillum salinarum AK4]|uniref:Glutathione S-transferase, omega n=1 Tax=Caenispirillum salinarum AK4 TaxID=1238182 RepID=K9H331_9PROT|nr:glutathione S-transferase family protein [Caenispirillum salinarum]EKV32630.1 Glutathione S-transferase, omega [Caenispirillum salinarum AK4]
MGLLIDGQWHDQWYDTKSTGGRFKRQESAFRDRIGTDRFPAEAGRYHLYVSLACPWAHRTLIFRALKGLEEAISVSVVDPLMLDNGWEFGEGGDPLYGLSYLREIYTRADPHYTGRVTVPVLWDREGETIVNNESAELIRMLNADFGALASGPDFYPEALRGEIDAVNARVYDAINNGVYKTGFATTQEAYEEAYDALFAALDWVEERLSRHRYLVGDTMTEADWRLFTTLVRFDPVYVGHFKCNRNRIADFPNMLGYLRELYQVPGVAGTVSFDHIKRHYYASHTMINPTGIVPKGPAMDLTLPHGRG